MADQTILIVDDDMALAEMVGIVLRGEDFETEFCPDGDHAVERFREVEPDLVLLDLMLPGKDGIEICRELRSFTGTPIVMVTAKGDATDVVKGLESGADDYVVKPFDPKELVARVKARLRPVRTPEVRMLHIGDVTIDVTAHEVRRGSERLQLTPLEFNLLVTLGSKPNQVFTRDMLLERVWGYHYKADTRLVNVHVQRLRAKIESDPENPRVILTVRGVGYKAGEPIG